MEWRERAGAWWVVAAGCGGVATGDGWWFGLAAMVAVAAGVWCLVSRDEDWSFDAEPGAGDDVPPEDRPNWGTR